MKTAAALLLTLVMTTASGCNKDKPKEEQGRSEPAEIAATKEAKNEPKPKGRDCPGIYVDGEPIELCEIHYTTFRDYELAGKSAKHKRAKLTCRYNLIVGGEVWCSVSRLKSIVLEITDDIKPALRKLRKRQKVEVDFVVTIVGPLGPHGIPLSMRRIK